MVVMVAANHNEVMASADGLASAARSLASVATVLLVIVAALVLWEFCTLQGHRRQQRIFDRNRNELERLRGDEAANGAGAQLNAARLQVVLDNTGEGRDLRRGQMRLARGDIWSNQRSLLTIWTVPTTSTEGARKMAGNGQKIIELDRQRMTAMAAKDIAALNRLLADDLIYTHSSARLDTKKSLIGAMESGSTVYTAIEPSDVVAQDLGDAVVLTGVAAISVNSGGNPNSFRVRFTDVYANKGGQWQMVTWQSTRLA
jgi:ketosteroid isomerase-like protein